jgi:type I restriction enzyme S subunit
VSKLQWEQSALSEIADLCLGKMLDQNKNRGVLMPYLANVNVRWGEFILGDLRDMRFEDHERERYGLKHGDIVMCEGGEPGRCAIWKEQIPGMMIQKALHRIRPKAGIDSAFLYYSFRYLGLLKGFDQYFTGATIKHLPGEKLAKVEVRIPPLAIQRRIAGILSAYDDLIENNQRRIKILEEMARRLYREWFVHFRFPGHEGCRFVDSPLGEIPEGWEVKRLGEVTTKIGSGATPKGGKGAYKTEGIHLIRSLNIYDYSFQFDNLAFIDEDQAAGLDNVRVQQNDVLLNITGASVARCAMVPSYLLPARVNQHVAIIRATEAKVSPHYLLDAINSDFHKQKLLSYAQGGATREALTKETISGFEILVPPTLVMSRYAGVASGIHLQRETLTRQVQNLRRTRDLLLPRLLSGQIDVEALQEVAAVEP